MERRGKSSPECGRPYCHVNPIRSNTVSVWKIRRRPVALPWAGGWNQWATAGLDRLSSQQNPAYVLSHAAPRQRGAVFFCPKTKKRPRPSRFGEGRAAFCFAVISFPATAAGALWGYRLGTAGPPPGSGVPPPGCRARKPGQRRHGRLFSGSSPGRPGCPWWSWR